MTFSPAPPPQVPEVDIEELDRVRAGGVALVDVRQPEEYVAGHVPGARLIPMSEVAGRVGEIPTDAAVYVICATGNRSAKATEWLRRRGVDARSVAGGTKAWAESGKAVVRGSNTE